MIKHTFNYRDFLSVIAVGILAVCFGGLLACAKTQPLKIAVQPWCGYQFMFLAQQEKMFRNNEIELIKTAGASESVAALKQGKVDGAALTLDEVLRLRDEGMRLSVVAILDISAGADVILAKPSITKPSDLKGKRIGIETTSLGAVFLSKLLEAGGLKPDEVTVIPIDEHHLAAWENLQLDAIQAYEPTLSQLESKGLARIFDSSKMPHLMMDVLAVRTEVAENKAASLRNLVASHFEELYEWNINPIDNNYHLAALMAIKPENVKSVYKGLDLPDAVYNRHYLIAPSTSLNQSANEVAAIMLREGMLKHPLSLDQLFVADYLPGENE